MNNILETCQQKVDPTWQVGQSSDDCWRRLYPLAWSLTTVYCNAGAYNASYYKYGCGMRFTGITIPQGSTINSAYLTLRASTSQSGTVVKSRISAEDVDDAPTFDDNANAFDTRWANRTAARVAWDSIPAWTEGIDYNSPEIKTVIQEIVDREGWASGNDIVIFWEDYEDRSTHASECYRQARSYDESPAYAPKLVIEFTPPLPEATTQAVSDIGAETATGHGTITDIGGENCSKRGVCWNTTGNPTVADDKSEETGSFGTGAFTRPMTGLTPGQLYYVRAYAYNSAGYGYGAQVEFTTKTYYATGYIGDVIDCTELLKTYDRLEWTEEIPDPGQAIEIKIRSSPDLSTWTDWEVIYSSPCTSFGTPVQRYLEWVATLTTDQGTPKLKDLGFFWTKKIE